jgi:predicted transcriptional regulator
MITINENNIFDNYEQIKEEIKFFTNSEIRLRILKCLNEKDLAMSNIYNETNLSYSSISSNVHKLEDRDYVYNDNGKYKLNDLAKIKLLDLMELNKLFDFTDDFFDFWNDHDVKNIYPEGLKNLNRLYGSKLIESSLENIYKPHNVFKSNILKSMNIKSIFPFIHPEYPNIFRKLIENGAKIKILLPNNIFPNFIRTLDKDMVKNAVENNLFEIKSLKSEIKMSLTVTDNFMSLGIFKNDGSYDQNRILISCKESAIEWGNEVFNHYYNSSNRIFINL